MSTRAILFNNATGLIINADNLILPPAKIIGFSCNVSSKTSNYTLGSSDDVIICNNSTSMTVTIPSGLSDGKVFNIKNASNVGSVTVDANVAASSTIDDELTQVVSSYENITIIKYSGSEWSII